MNEREFMLRMVIALANKSGYNEFEAAKEFAAEARKRGLFEAAPLAPTGAERLAEAERLASVSAAAAHTAEAENERIATELDAAKALLRVIAEEIEAFRLAVDTYDPSRLYALGSRAKEMTND